MEKTAKMKKILDICLNVLIWVIVAISLFMTILVFSAQASGDGVPAIFGKSLISIESKSMEPTFKQGDLILIDKLSDEEKADLEVGNIITYFAPIDINNDGKIGDINTHRIVKIDKDALTVKTQGDNPETNMVEDNYTLHFSDIIGTCEEDDRIGGVGAVIGFLRSSLGFFLCIVLPLILFFLYELYRFIALIVSERAKRAPVSKETEEEIKRRAIEEYLKSQRDAENEATETAETEKTLSEDAKTEESAAEDAAAEDAPEEEKKEDSDK